MRKATASGIFGVCHHSPAEVVGKMMAVLERNHVFIACSGEPLPRRRAYVLTSVLDLKALAPVLRRSRSTIVVCDSIANLRTVAGVEILDAPDAKTPLIWSPVKMQAGPLLRHLRRLKPPHPQIDFVRDDIVSSMIAEVKAHGILDKVLTMSHKVQNRDERKSVLPVVVKFLCGKSSIKSVEKALRPARVGTQTWQAYIDLIESLNGPYGKRLGKALKTIYPKFDAAVLSSVAERFHVDVFELRYIAHSARKNNK